MKVQKDFKTLLHDNEVTYPKHYELKTKVANNVGLLAFLLCFFVPFVEYDNRLSIVRSEYISLLRLYEEIGEFSSLILPISLILLGTLAAAFISIFSMLLMSKFFKSKRTKKPIKKSSFAKNFKLQWICLITCIILATIGIIISLQISTIISKYEVFEINSFWRARVGWGAYVIVVLLFVCIIVGLNDVIMLFTIKKGYESGKITEEQVIDIFKKSISLNQKAVNKLDSLSISDKISELKKLKDEGLISEEEFIEKKKELLSNFK